MCAFVAGRTGSSLSRQQVARLEVAVDAHRAGRTDAELLALLQSPQGAMLLDELMAALSVHKTDLFRDEAQLEAVRAHVLPQLALLGRPLRVWSAGCATGEEVATLLVMLAEAGAHPQSTVLGTDISQPALNVARTLTFSDEAMRRVPPLLRQRYFLDRHGQAQLVGPLASRASFLRHNLMDAPYPLPPGGGAFDLVFCRNVLIYFVEAAFHRAIDGFTERLRPGGVLVLSAAEPILRGGAGLKTVRFGQAYFYVRRPPGEEAPRQLGELRAPEGGADAPRPSVSSALLAWPSAPPPPLPSLSWPVAPPPPRPAASAPVPRPLPPPPAAVGKAPLAPPADPREEGVQLFVDVLESEVAGQEPLDVEARLRRALYLAPDLAQARYLLGVMLEGRGAKADAAAEFRRALGMLEDGRAGVVPFFLNNARLKVACAQALDRLGFPRG